MKQEKLKKCPFCGCEFINLNYIQQTGRVYLSCPKCRIETPLFETLPDAIKAWNRRDGEEKPRQCQDCRWCAEKNNEEPYCLYHNMITQNEYYCGDAEERKQA